VYAVLVLSLADLPLLLPGCSACCHMYRHASYNFRAFDFLSLHLNLFIWLVCAATAPPLSLLQLLTALCCVSGVAAIVLHKQCPAFYMQHRTAITTIRRVLTMPHIRQSAYKHMSATGPVSALVVHLLVQTGAMHNFVGSLFFLDDWRACECAAQDTTKCLE
jgi:hypothetical protein